MNLSQQELAILIGRNYSYISRLEKGQYKLTSPETITNLARVFKIKEEVLFNAIIGKRKVSAVSAPSNPESLLRELNALVCVQIPVRGSVPAGYPAFREETIEEYISITKEDVGMKARGLYALRVDGDSLEGDNIYDGDLVIIEPHPELENGKIYIVRLGDEVLVRHVYKEENKLRLVSSNSHYEDINLKGCEILGRVILSGKWRRQ